MVRKFACKFNSATALASSYVEPPTQKTTTNLGGFVGPDVPLRCGDVLGYSASFKRPLKSSSKVLTIKGVCCVYTFSTPCKLVRVCPYESVVLDNCEGSAASSLSFFSGVTYSFVKQRMR